MRAVPCQHGGSRFRNSAALLGSSHKDVIFNRVGFAGQLKRCSVLCGEP